MTRGIKHTDAKTECIRLRTEERLSYKEITERTGVTSGSLSVWLRDIPLSKEEKRAKHTAAQVGVPRKPRAAPSKYLEWADVGNLSRREKGAIAEAAVTFRATLSRLVPFSPLFDGTKEDLVVGIPGESKVARIQIKWAKSDNGKISYIPLRCMDGHNTRRRYGPNDFDFIVGYDFYSDIAYVFSSDEVSSRTAGVTIQPDAAERWDKVRDFILRA